MTAFLAIGVGAAIGAWLRWGLGLWLNPVFPSMPLGTLAANLVGGYFIGLVIAWFAEHPGVPPEARLFLITGLLGGLTTFSTYALETASGIRSGAGLMAVANVLLNNLCGLLLVLAGMWLVNAVFKRD